MPAMPFRRHGPGKSGLRYARVWCETVTMTLIVSRPVVFSTRSQKPAFSCLIRSENPVWARETLHECTGGNAFATPRAFVGSPFGACHRPACRFGCQTNHHLQIAKRCRL